MGHTQTPISEVLVVHPFTGEIFDDLDKPAADDLASTLAAIRDRQAQLKDMATRLETELRKRLGPNRRHAVFGHWEVESGRRRRVWDGAELEGVLSDFVERGVLPKEQAVGVVVWEPKVSGQEALRVLHRVDGPAKADVERCFVWKEEGRLGLTRSAELVPQIPDSGIEERAILSPSPEPEQAFDESPAEALESPQKAAESARGPSPAKTSFDIDELFA